MGVDMDCYRQRIGAFDVCKLASQYDTDKGTITLHLVCVTIDINIVTDQQSLTIQGISFIKPPV